MSGDPISADSKAAIRAAKSAHRGVYVSPFTAWEIGTLVAKERLHLTLDPDTWFEKLLSLPGIRLAPLTPKILLASTRLPGTPPTDPADRILAATARIENYLLITRDHKLLSYARQGHLHLIPC